MNRHNPYGYKVCLKKPFRHILRFKTYTYESACEVVEHYYKYPPDIAIGVKRPVWVIIPIRKSEVMRGIWREVPF